MKKTMAFAISSAILLNSFQLAMASNETDLAKDVIDRTLGEKEIIQLLRSADAKTTQDLIKALKDVRGLMEKISALQSINDTDPVLKYANQTQMILLALSAYTAQAHLKKADANNLVLALSTASMALNTFITHYKQNNKVDSTVLSQIVFDTSRDLSKAGNLSPELTRVTGSLNIISSTLLDNQGQIAGILTGLTGTSAQDVALVASFSYLILHLVYPRVAKETDGFLKNVLPKIEQGIASTTAATKKTIAVGGTGATAVTDLLGMTIGMNSEQSQKLILQTLINLDNSANKLESEIKYRQMAK
ncbi:MAG: hypothetical protein H7328_03685 [Bdellovibrio sp.]|nr:hypothetical protein [Bdellovibrio sp.]